jgi:ABC-type transporter Mla maintaining outer membrane lipid asymmetry permease subunit MlaE
MTALLTFIVLYPDQSVYYWRLSFFTALVDPGKGFFYQGFPWVLGKTVTCGFGIGVISYLFGSRPKSSAESVSRAVTQAIVWTTIYVLLVHMVFALFEFTAIKPEPI